MGWWSCTQARAVVAEIGAGGGLSLPCKLQRPWSSCPCFESHLVLTTAFIYPGWMLIGVSWPHSEQQMQS